MGLTWFTHWLTFQYTFIIFFSKLCNIWPRYNLDILWIREMNVQGAFNNYLRGVSFSQQGNTGTLIFGYSVVYDVKHASNDPERFIHLTTSYVYQSMDLTNDKPSDCEMSAIFKDFKWELFPHPPYSLDLAPLWLSSVSGIERPPRGQALLDESWTQCRNFVVLFENGPIVLPSWNRKTGLAL